MAKKVIRKKTDELAAGDGEIIAIRRKEEEDDE